MDDGLRKTTLESGKISCNNFHHGKRASFGKGVNCENIQRMSVAVGSAVSLLIVFIT